MTWVGTWRAGYASLAKTQPLVQEVRAVGLAIGVQVVDAASASAIVEAMRVAGVLIGVTGRHGNTLKIRPPLVFQREHADQVVTVLDFSHEHPRHRGCLSLIRCVPGMVGRCRLGA